MKKKKSLAHLVSVSLTPEKEMNSKIMWSVYLALSHKLVSLNKAKIPGVYNSKERSLYIVPCKFKIVLIWTKEKPRGEIK